MSPQPDFAAAAPAPTAASGATHSATRPSAPRRRLWPWLLAAVLGVLLLALAAGVAGTLSMLEGAAHDLDIWIDGERWRPPAMDLDATTLGLITAVAAALLLGLLLTVLLMVLAVVAASGLAALLAGTLALAPLWLPLLLLWLLLRRPGRKPQAA